MRAPLHKRIARSERWRQRYRSDPEFRLAHFNRSRASAGLPPVSSLPPVGEVRPAWAATRKRNEKGLWV